MNTDITSALRTLYGDEALLFPAPLLQPFQPENLKAVFRRRALELHPDRALVLGKSPEEMNEAFKEVKLAYELLMDLPGTSSRPSARFRHPDPSHPDTPQEDSDDRYHESGIPNTRMLFGQFLYYAGLITLKTLHSAVTWQQRHRPSFGKIALMWDYLTLEEIRLVEASKMYGEKIGESATRRGCLTAFQCHTILGFQKYLQRPIGEFFQEIGILEEEEIAFLVRLMRKHNARVGLI